jgi:dTMP kinase
MSSNPMFITFEGLDGCGKTTQARLLAESLTADGVEVFSTREPGGTPLGEEIRDLVLHGDHIAPWAETALYLAARAQHVDQVIRPALAGGATVVCDRYLDTSVAYQGGGRELGVDTVLELNLLAVDGLVPDRTVLVEIDVETALARVGDKRDRIEQAEAEFWPRVVDAYRDLAARYPERYVVVDGRRPVREIAEEIRERLR